MFYQQPNVAPEECKGTSCSDDLLSKESRCVYLEEITTSSGVQRDRCLKGIPMQGSFGSDEPLSHNNCAWKVTIEELRKSV